jgi:hypothetical protein
MSTLCTPSPGEQVLHCKLVRDRILGHLNPWKLSDLRCVLELRCFKGILSDEDLRHCFRRVWSIAPATFLLEDWSTMTADEVRGAVTAAVTRQRSVGLPHTVIGEPIGFETMTKGELRRHYGALRYVPTPVFLNGVRGARTLMAASGRLPARETFKGWSFSFSLGAVRSGLDDVVVSRIIEEEYGALDDIRKRDLEMAAREHGHTTLCNHFMRS